MDEIRKLLAKSTGETIGEHTDNLLADLKQFQSIYGKYFTEETLGEIAIACKYHDYGKSVLVFQKLIQNTAYLDTMDKNIRDEIEAMYKKIGFEKNIPHGYISPMFLTRAYCKELKELYGDDGIKRIVTAIYYHHTRDAVERELLTLVQKRDLKVRFQEQGIKFYCQVYDYLYSENGLLDNKTWVAFAIVMGMLNKLDYHASDTHAEKLPLEMDRIYQGKYLNTFVSNFFEQHQFEKNACQNYALQNKEKNIIIIASTGIGKTETAMLWADGEKLFYTLPLKVSINAMYERLAENYGYDKEKVALLHSSALEELLSKEHDDYTEAMIKYAASRMLSYPVTICTVDQLFSFVYKYHGCEQYLATLKYSRLVIDEIQSYEPKMIAKILYGLKLISIAGGKFAIITATLPPFVYEEINRMGIPCEPPQRFLMTDKTRHKIHMLDDTEFDFAEMVKLSASKKILVICNTVKRACAVYSKLKEACDAVKLLHSNFILKDRKRLETDILNFANDPDATGICVATQIVEASLDIDFDVLYTEMSSADSLLQRMGRCYRKRDYSGQTEPNVHILINGNGKGYIYDEDIYNRSVKRLRRYDGQFFTESEKLNYIDAVYKTDEIQETNYYKKMREDLHSLENIMPFAYSKSEAKRKLRDIVSYTVIPKSIYDSNMEAFSYAIAVLRGERKTEPEERIQQRRFLQNHSMSISAHDKRRNCLSKMNFDDLDYYVVSCKYDFEESTLTGLGLTYDFDEDSDFL